MSELEELATSQSHELRIQFERIAQLQAECDILRIRFTKSGVMPSRNIKGGQADGAKIQDLA